MRVLLTGATGYVGGCLLDELQRRGHDVRCMARRPEKLAGRAGPRTEVVAGDASHADDLARACAGVDVAYWLVHSMESGVDFERADRLAAERFAAAAVAAGVRRIIYLGGLGADDDRLSAHLRSRHEVGAILRASGLDVIEFRASIVIGAGSFSFDLVRTLVERLPVMICPAWLATATQPIAIADVVAYLAAAIELPAGGARIFEIGGPDRVSYGAIMREYARQRGLTRLMIPVPVLTPRLSSLWLKLVTPRYSKMGRKLIDGLKNPTVVTSVAADRDFTIRPRDLACAVREAVQHEDQEFAGKRWADFADLEELPRRYGGATEGTRLVDHRHAVVAVSPARAFAAIERIGGGHGWYACNWLWTLRGWLDRLLGGPGMSRGRRDPDRLCEGETLDCWRVEVCEPPRRLRLAAEMKMPGRGWLEFEVVPRDGDVTIHQTAVFDPKGLGGLVYWYAIWPLHEVVFRRMLAGIARAAVRAAE
ncbi:MAG: SDR family oxidoreductase [Planctomycetia bacterium]|nr:SDR family oxidoreductase [Planctomycetia bacterium]